ncbi:MAG: hydroxymethylglutaryl-CoA reductase, degradative [Candidatus Heimdallarchaeota archaeon]|nr:MAG: hydroxymethylglutaryl-CoA reductase, degradative [Candidatus Heimdallarchaeota archaeon]
MSDEQKINSRIAGFFRKSPEERQSIIQKLCNLNQEEMEYLKESTSILDKAGQGHYIENTIAVMQIPLGIATNFTINETDYLIPMAVEEASVVAAASNSAKIARTGGGFFTSTTPPIMIGQIQIINIPDPHNAREKILEQEKEIIELANKQDPILVKFGGGCRGINVKVLPNTLKGFMVITELLVDVRDAMGANAVNTMNEAVAALLETITGGQALLRIISNLADRRLVRARAVFKASELETSDMKGKEVVEGILNAYAFAEADPYRCCTHNKGIMNGIDAVAIATAQDWRAIEAGAHTYAAVKILGKYSSLTTWEKDMNGDLVGTIEIPLAVGLVGGVARIHPLAQISFKILGLSIPGGALKLAEIMAAVGLAQNFGALRALATVGIQAGHMKLHARNLAASMGAKGTEIDAIVQKLDERKLKVTFDTVKEIYDEIKS